LVRFNGLVLTQMIVTEVVESSERKSGRPVMVGQRSRSHDGGGEGSSRRLTPYSAGAVRDKMI